jgi:hypothetical protein
MLLCEVLLRYLLAGCQEFLGTGAECRRQPGAGAHVIWLAGAVAAVWPPPVAGAVQQELW